MIKVQGAYISNRTELKHQISVLESHTSNLERKVLASLVEVYYELHPITVLKSAALSIIKSGELKQDLKTYSLNSVINFLLSKVLGKNRSIKGFLSNFFIQRIVSNTVSGNSGQIFSAISNAISWLKSSLTKREATV